MLAKKGDFLVIRAAIEGERLFGLVVMTDDKPRLYIFATNERGYYSVDFNIDKEGYSSIQEFVTTHMRRQGFIHSVGVNCFNFIRMFSGS